MSAQAMTPSGPPPPVTRLAVGALGTCMLHPGATGLGALQKPLLGMYTGWRQSATKPPKLQACDLSISVGGLTVTPKTGSGGVEQHYPLPDILLWDAVQFVVVKDKKKMCSAFEPLDNDHSRNKDNLFSSLDKKLHYLQPLSHPALLTCVIRRALGVKSLDVHVFVCGNSDEAVMLVSALSQAQAVASTKQANESGVFGYKPFQAQLPPPGASSRHSSTSSSITTPTAVTVRPQQPPQSVTPAASVSQANNGRDGAPNSRTNNSVGLIRDDNSAIPKNPRSPDTVGRPLSNAHRSRSTCILTQEFFSGSQLNLASPTLSLPPQPEPDEDPDSQDTSRNALAGSRNNLTESGGKNPVNSRTNSLGSIHSQATVTTPDSSRTNSRNHSLANSRTNSLSSEHTRSLVRASPSGDSRTSSLTSARSLASVLCASQSDSGFQSAATDSTAESSSKGSGKKKSKKDKKEKKEKEKEKDKDKKDKEKEKDKDKNRKKAAIVKPLPPEDIAHLVNPNQPEEIRPTKGKNLVRVLPTSAATPNLKPTNSGGSQPGSNTPTADKLGEGYSLLSGSGGYLPGHNPPRPSPPASRRSDSHYEGGHDQGQFRHSPHPHPEGPYMEHPGPPNMDYDYEVDINMFRQQRLSSQHREESQNRGRRPTSPVSSHRSSASSHVPRHQLRPPKSPGYLDRPPVMPPRPSVRHEDSPMPVLRPVALVTPHKVAAGVPAYVTRQQPPSSKFRDYEPMPLRAKYEDNWHFGHQADEDYDRNEYWCTLEKPQPQPQGAPSHQAQQPQHSPNPHEGELLLNQKKDAEIASVMQNLQFEYTSQRTLTPGAPGGMNFERSLGYFP